MKRVRIIIDGRVQGIGFRYFVSNKAREHDIKGYVRNMHDGRVEIDAEGESENLHRFMAACRRGPSMARVDEFIVHDVPEYGFSNFSIKT